MPGTPEVAGQKGPAVARHPGVGQLAQTVSPRRVALVRRGRRPPARGTTTCRPRRPAGTGRPAADRRAVGPGHRAIAAVAGLARWRSRRRTTPVRSDTSDPDGSRRGSGWPATAPAGPAARPAARSTSGRSSTCGDKRSRAPPRSPPPTPARRRAGDRRPCRGPGACGPTSSRADAPRPRSHRRPAREGHPRRRGRAPR